MNSRSFRNVVISYFVLCFLSFGAFGTRYLVIDSDVSAQKTNPTLPGDKSSQDLEIPFTEGEYEVGPDFLFESKADVVQGRIIDIKTTYEDYSAYTTYTIETQRIIRPYLLDKETLGLYMANNSAPPEAIGQTFKISRSGGKVMVHGRRVTYTVPAMEKFVKDQSYIFFLGWSSNSKTHTLVGSNSGAFLVQDSGALP